jgi:hypothetical protein
MPIPSDTLPRPASTRRRQSPRFEVLGRIVGYLTSRNMPVRVREVGFGGFSIETLEPVTTAGVESVRFTTHDDWSASLLAQSLHCRPSCAADGSPRYVTGFQFVDQDLTARQSVAYLIKKVTGVELFEIAIPRQAQLEA